MDMFVVKRPNPVSLHIVDCGIASGSQEGEAGRCYLPYICCSNAIFLPLHYRTFRHFYRTSTALFGKITGAVPHLFARKTAPKHCPCPEPQPRALVAYSPSTLVA